MPRPIPTALATLFLAATLCAAETAPSPGQTATEKPTPPAAPAETKASPATPAPAPTAKPHVEQVAYPEFGSRAPKLKPDSWVQGEPLTDLNADRVHLIAFWSAINAPSAKAIPVLNDYHRRFAARGLKVLGVSVWEESLTRVKDFIKGRGDAMVFPVAFDGREANGTVAADWLEAADLNGIPYLFAVRAGKVLWHGHPSELDEKKLLTMLDGTYDVAAAIRLRTEEQEARNRAQPIIDAIDEAFLEGKIDEALRRCDELEKTLPERERPMANLIRAEALFEKSDFKAGFARLGRYVDAYRNEPEVLAMTALSIAAEPRFEGHRDHALALRCVDRALEIAPVDPYRMLRARVLYTAGRYAEAETILKSLAGSDNNLLREHLKLILEAVAKREPWPISATEDCACGSH